MTSLIAPLNYAAYAVVAAAIWGFVTCLLPLTSPQWHLPAFWVCVVLGVPVLGWLTFAVGPGAGVGALALGLLLLVRSPLARFKAPRRPDQSSTTDRLPPAAAD